MIKYFPRAVSVHSCYFQGIINGILICSVSTHDTMCMS